MLRSILESDIAGRMTGGRVAGAGGAGGEGGAALPLLSQELEEGSREEEQRQREKAKQMFISQASTVNTYK